MVSYIAPKQAADQSLHLLAATYFYYTTGVWIIATEANKNEYKKIGSATVIKKRSDSSLLIKCGGIVRTSSYVCGLAVNVDNQTKQATMTNLHEYTGTYGVVNLNGVPAGQQEVTLNLYVSTGAGGCTAEAVPYQYYPLEVYEVY